MYPATIIPIFPEKRVLGNAEEGFIAERMAGLAAYIDKVGRAGRGGQGGWGEL